MIYASILGEREYFIYDPYGETVTSFIGYRHNNGVYQENKFLYERLYTEVLRLELGRRDGKLHLYNPRTEKWLPTHKELIEQAEAKLEINERTLQMLNAIQNAEERAEKAEVDLQKY